MAANQTINTGNVDVNNSVNTVVETGKKWWDSLDIKKWSEQIGGSSAEAVEAAIYFCLAFGIGFLLKKYFKLLIACTVVTIFVVLAMEYLKFIAIDWQALKAAAGITPGMSINMVITNFFDWIKAHILLFVASVVGVLIGYKLG